MAIITNSQGAVKDQEIATVEAFPYVDTNINEDLHTVIKQNLSVSMDALKKLGYIFYSQGQVQWVSSALKFHNNSAASNVFLRFTQMEDSARTIDLQMTGNLITNGLIDFNSIPMTHNDILYLQINRTGLLASSGTVIVQNGVNGGATTGVAILKIINASASTGVPQLFSSQDGTNTDTLNIPIAMCMNYNYDSSNYNDIYFIPHGIRWPKATVSQIGAVIVDGFQSYPDFYCATEAQLDTALAACATGGSGGIICITQPITLTSTKTIPPYTKIWGKSWGRSVITLNSGVGINLGSHCEMSNLFITNTALSISNTLVNFSVGARLSLINNCYFKLTNTSGNLNCITFSNGSALCKTDRCVFDLGVGTIGIVSYRTAIEHAGSNNADVDSYIV